MFLKIEFSSTRLLVIDIAHFYFNRHHFYIPEMKTTKLKDFKNMAFIPCFLFFPPQASLSFMLFPLLSKKWLIFAKSYYYRSMCYPMYAYTYLFYECRFSGNVEQELKLILIVFVCE